MEIQNNFGIKVLESSNVFNETRIRVEIKIFRKMLVIKVTQDSGNI